MKKFDLDYESFRRLTAKYKYADDFAKEYREYVLDYPFEDAYIVRLQDGYYRVDYMYEYGLGVFFDGIRRMTQEEWQEVFHEYEQSFEKLNIIKQEK